MAVTNIFIIELTNSNWAGGICKEKEKPCRSNMFVLSLTSLALRAISHICCASAIEETALGNDLLESVARLKCAAEHGISHQ